MLLAFAMEFCVPAAAAFDESFRKARHGVLH